MDMDDKQLKRLAQQWKNKGAKESCFGKSVSGLPLYAYHVGGQEPPQQIVVGAIHAREHLSADVVAAQVEYTLAHLDSLVGGVWFVPIANPDGVRLCLYGAETFDNKSFLLAVNGGNKDFSMWKANARAVDLNCNFPADFGKGKGNVFRPSPSSYIGEYAASEPETAALIRLTETVRPALTVSYHSKGREIYWEYGQHGTQRAKNRALAYKAGEVTGYRVVDGTLDSAGGYKDYCIQSLHISALTIELFWDGYRHPVPITALGQEIERTQSLACVLSREVVDDA